MCYNQIFELRLFLMTPNRRSLLAQFYAKGYVPPSFEGQRWRPMAVPPGSGNLVVEVATEAGYDEAFRYVYFRARYTPPGMAGEITMYLWLMRKKKGARPDGHDFEESCDIHGYCGASFPAYVEDLFLDCGLFSTDALFAAGGVLEFVVLVAPPGLNQHSSWKDGAERVIAEISKRYRPALLILKAYPLELMDDRGATWGPSRQAALKRLYGRTLGVQDLDHEGFMWKPLRTKGPITLWAEHAEAVFSKYFGDPEDPENVCDEPEGAPGRLLICAWDTREG